MRGPPAVRSCDDEDMRITGVASTDKFAGTTARPFQIIQVTLADAGPHPVLVRIEGPGVTTPEPSAADGPGSDPGGDRAVSCPRRSGCR